MSLIYQEQFPKGSMVRVKDRPSLVLFQKEWRYHNPLTDAQLNYAGKVGTVASIGVYHGGDILYSLDEIPGIWHERCLQPAG